jgi:hypothetical protein
MTRELFIVTLTPQPGVAGLLALRALLKVALTPAERQKLYAERQQNGLIVLPVVVVELDVTCEGRRGG